MPNLSIIVLAYGFSQHVRQSLQRILCQNYQDFEVLVVDNGSKDGNGEIALQDLRVRAIHKENAGLLQARRTGVENATGTYIGFVDGGDYIDPSMYQILMENAVQTDADIVCCGCYFDSEDGHTLRNITFKEGNAIFTSQEALVQLWEMAGIYNSFCNKIYRKTLFNDFEYLTGNPVGEDYFSNIQLLNKYENCRSQIMALYLCMELDALVAMGRNRVIDVEKARRIGRDAHENFKYLLRFKMPLRFIMAGAVTAIHWRLFVDMATFLSWLKVL